MKLLLQACGPRRSFVIQTCSVHCNQFFSTFVHSPSFQNPSLCKKEMASTDEISLSDRLKQLNEAEECVCTVMQLAADTCTALQRLPFADATKLQSTADEVLTNLQKIRSLVVDNIEAVQPIDVQKQSVQSSTEIDLIHKALEQLK